MIRIIHNSIHHCIVKNIIVEKKKQDGKIALI